MKKTVKITLIWTLVFLVIYIAQCVYISFKIKKMIDASYETYGEINKFPDDISDLNFLRMCFRSVSDKDRTTHEEKSCSFPITLVFFNKAKAWYWWEHYRWERDGDHAGAKSGDLPDTVDLELKNFRWCVTNVKANP